MKAGIFLRPNGASGFGHVGFAFQHPNNGTHCVGAAENPHGWLYQPADKSGYWHLEGQTNPEVVFRRPPNGFPCYQIYKVLDVPNPNYQNALNRVLTIKKTDWQLFGNNCMDVVYEVLTLYGASLPNPKDIQNWKPNDWFHHIPAKPSIIKTPVNSIDISLYQHENFGGHNLEIFKPGQYTNLHDSGWGDMLTSVVVRSGYIAMYEHINFGGKSIVMGPGEYDTNLSKRLMNDQISSFYVSETPIK